MRRCLSRPLYWSEFANAVNANSMSESDFRACSRMHYGLETAFANTLRFLGEPLDVQFFAGRRECDRNSLWLNKSGSPGLRSLQRLQVIQDQRGKQETLPDGLVGICAEFAPEVTILEELKRVSSSPFCIIDEVSVIAVGDLHL